MEKKDFIEKRNKIQSKAYNNIIMMIINDDDDNMNIILNTISEKRKEKSTYLLYGHKYLINNTKIDSLKKKKTLK